jgi:hypothetical protein
MSPKTSHELKQPTTPRLGSQLGERILVGALTALIVARPLVLGDDPGRLRLTSGGGPLWLNLLTFLLLLGWAVSRGITRRRLVVGPYLIVVVGFLMVAGCAFASAAQPDRYQRPGWFIAWDWVAYAALAFVAGQLAANVAIARGLVAALIATAGCLAAQALYETVARENRGPRTVPEPLTALDVPLVGDDHYNLRLNDPPPPVGAFRATLDQPDTLAALLLLIVPALLVWAAAGWNKGGRGAGIPLLAILVFVALAMALISWVVGTSTAGKGSQAASGIIRDRPLLGCGPGNFSRNAPSGIAGAGNFWLGFAATAGLLALVLFAFTLASAAGVLLRQMRRMTADLSVAPTSDYRWSFYLGGMAGLLLGMMLATGDLSAEAPSDEMMRLGAVSAGRSLAWFLIFAALEIAAPSGRNLVLSLGIGAAVVAVFGGVSDGLLSPALMVPFAIVAMLALSRFKSPSEVAPVSLPVAWMAVPIALALAMANLMHVGMPGLFTAVSVRDARARSVHFPEINKPTMDPANPDLIKSLREADNYLLEFMLIPLKESAKLDGGNSALFSEIALWERQHVHYLLLLGERERGVQRTQEILSLDEAIARIDPRNPTPRFSELEAMLFLIRRSSVATPPLLKRLEQLVKQIVEYDARREVFLRFRVVSVLLTRRNPEAADPWAVRLLRLDVVPGEPHGYLTPRQRRSLQDQLKKIKEPSAELAQLLKSSNP